MKDFAGSSITYYGLAREKLINKYPRLISVLIILALICTTGLAIFLISDLVSFASNPDYKGAGLDFKGQENGIPSTANDKEKSGSIGTNSSLNMSSQNKEQSPVNLSKMNASLPSSQAAKGVVATGKSSSSSSQSSVDKKSGNSPVIRHHSSSSSSSSKSSSANSATKSSEMNNLTNETATVPMPTNETATIPMQTDQSMNNSQEQESVFSNASSSVNPPPIDATNSAITISSNLSSEGQGSILSDEESANSQGAEVATTAVLTSLPSAAIGSFTNPAENTPAREPVSIIEFKTETKLSPKSEQDINPDNGASTDGTSVSDNANKAKSSKVATKNIKLKTTKTKSASSKKSKLTTSSQAAKVKEARDKMKTNKDRIEQNMKKKAAQLRSKTA
jgi:hypothetical protein